MSAGAILLAPLQDLPGVRHAFFTREGGCSEGVFASLNCGYSTGDLRDRVASNRGACMGALGVAPEALASVHQIHSNLVVTVDEDWTFNTERRADALVTKIRGIALGVLSADCAPVLFADARAGVIGAAHAGWRGALSGVVDETVAGMVALGAQKGRIAAAIGPCIARDSYEVGPEFPAPFLEADSANERYFSVSRRPGHFQFDLPGYLVGRLTKLGIGTVGAAGGDTAADPARFFSHRRSQLAGEGAAGRLLSAIVLEA